MPMYPALELFSWYSCNMFFRDIKLINVQNVPKQGATIVYGNHNNQFVDGMLLMNAIQRKIHFIAAAKSCRRPVIGAMIRGSGAIPVQRPQDVEPIKGKGKLITSKQGILRGEGTKFSQLVPQSLISTKNGKVKIKRIINDEELVIQGQINIEQNGETFKYYPKLDFNDLYKAVWDELKRGQCIGIFPEGGSHDRLGLLPLKAGICIMALGAIQKYNVPVRLVPCGFNYYNPHKFRSKAILQFGPAYEIPEQLVVLYRKDKHKAISILLQNLQRMLKAVTIQFRSYQQLSALYLSRQLYSLSAKNKISTKQQLQLNRRFAKGYEIMKTNPKYQQTYKLLLKFTHYIQISGISIKKQDFYGSKIIDILKFIVYFQKCILRLAIALPGFIMMGPTTSLIVYLAQKQRIKCLKGSKVKLHGNDVVGSYKIMLSSYLMPLTCAIHSILLYFALKKWSKLQHKMIIKLSMGLFTLQPLYALIFVKSFDSFKTSWQKLKYLFLGIFKKNSYQEFNREKKNLQKRIIQVVQDLGSQVVQDFQKNRIIKKQQIQIGQSNLYIFDKQQKQNQQ